MVEGEPVEVGDLHYNVIFSRYLNPNDNEDSAYLVGQAPPAPETTYFGVFFEVQNETEETQPLPDKFTIEDSDHEVFESLESESLFAFPLGGEVEEQEQIPVLDPPPSRARSRARSSSSCCPTTPPRIARWSSRSTAPKGKRARSRSTSRPLPPGLT